VENQSVSFTAPALESEDSEGILVGIRFVNDYNKPEVRVVSVFLRVKK